MELRPGLRLESTTCATQIVVVRAPSDPAMDVDLRCGGAPLRELVAGGDPAAGSDAAGGTLIGKRYMLDDLGLEVLCTRGGEGSLSVGEEPLVMKGAKPLPSSD